MPSATGYEHAAVLGARSALPFVLGALPIVQEDLRMLAILQRLDALQELAVESRRDLDTLRRLSSEVLHAVKAPQGLERGESRVNPQAGDAGPLRLRLLGSFEVRVNERPVSQWPSKKARLLLAYLAIEPGRLVPKDILIDLLWPDAAPERGSNNLSIAVHQIRATLAKIEPPSAQAIVVRHGLYGLNKALVSVDLWEYQELLTAARRSLDRKDKTAARASLMRAVDLCQGEFLESDPYEEWTAEPRRSWNAAHNQALAWLATEASVAADWPMVLDVAGRILQRERCDEAGHRWLMLAHWKTGKRPQALQQYRLCEELLQAELAVEPSEETRRLYAAILGVGV